MKKIIVLMLCLMGGSLLWAQENTVLGTGALSQGSSPKYAIQQIQQTNFGNYSRPTLDFGSYDVQIEYLSIFPSSDYLSINAYIKTLTPLGTFVPSVVGGHGTGATVAVSYNGQYDGHYYYEIFTDNRGSGYSPEVSLSSSAGSYQLYCFIDDNGSLIITYHDFYKTNLYTTPPSVNISFGGATAVAVLESTAANGQNTAIGYQALYNSTSSDNVALGNKAGYDLTSGKNNTILGPSAGKGITTGSGNTIIGATNVNLSSGLSNSVILADGNGNNRLFFSQNGNALIGYGTNFTDEGYRLDVNGKARFNSGVTGNGIDAFSSYGLTLNKVLSYDVNQVIHAPTSKAFIDLLAFNRRGYGITYETSGNKINFNSTPVDMRMFAGKAGTEAQQQVIDGTTIKAVRWTWSGVIYCNARWLALDYGHTNGTNANITIEQSNDGINWDPIHQSAYFLATSGQTKYHFLNYTGDRNYIRLTITHGGGGFVNLSNIKLLTFRLGNQGAAPEYAYPYTWNKDGWIGINKGVAEPEYPLDVNGNSRLAGTLILNEPASSTGTYDLLTRNTSTGAVEKLGAKMHRALDWILNPGAEANTVEENTSSFTYANNAPYNGFLGHFGNGGYGLQLNASYFGNNLAYRSRNGDQGSWNDWKSLVHEDLSSNWATNISGSASKWNNNSFDLGDIAAPSYFVTGLGGSNWGYSSMGQLKSSLGLPTSGGFDLHGSTIRGNVTTNNIIAQSFGVRYDDGSTYQTIGRDVSGLGTLYRSYITAGDVPIHRFQGSEANVDLLVIKNGGNVGIGIENPLEKLAVNGKIRAREVKVEPTNGWPDYVFEADYKPLSLTEISSFIKKNKHLPEVPSAKDVAQNGIELGEMNKLLLKKIEELTLHLIEKDQQLNVEKKINNKQNEQIFQLQQQFLALKELIEKKQKSK